MKGIIAKLRHVTLRYESGTQALDDVSLEVRRGERLCVLGANGSGKSTLASVLCGLLAPDEGSVELVGESVFDSMHAQGAVDYAAYARARRSVGLVFQNPDDQIVTTVVEEDVAFGPENLGVSPAEIGVRVERELKRVAMSAYAKADPTRLSGGQKQRVAIAGALAMEPELIVFDEPGSLLDVRGRSAIMRVMGRLAADGATIVHITHFMDEALEADRVIVLDRGRVVLEGTPGEVFSAKDTIEALGLEEPFEMRLARRCTDAAQGGQSPVRNSVQGRLSPSANSAKAVVKVRNVCYSYAGAGGYRALDDVSFSVEKGTSVAIVGQTGSGKSTLLRLLCALEAPDAGEVVINDICTRRKRDRRRLHGTVGYVMQHPERQLFANTVMEDVAFGPSNLGLSGKKLEDRCRAALDLVGLYDLDDASPFELSGGQQRLCAIAGVLAMQPQILVLDEPTAGLDPRGRAELRNILALIHENGTTTIEVTHSMDDAAMADEVIVLDQSRIMMAGAPREVFSAAHAGRLAKAGLGLPAALQWALDHGIDGEPLSLDELADALSRLPEGERPCWGAGEKMGKPCSRDEVTSHGA